MTCNRISVLIALCLFLSGCGCIFPETYQEKIALPQKTKAEALFDVVKESVNEMQKKNTYSFGWQQEVKRYDIYNPTYGVMKLGDSNVVGYRTYVETREQGTELLMEVTGVEPYCQNKPAKREGQELVSLVRQKLQARGLLK